VIFLEHRWLHGITGSVPSEIYREPIGSAKVVKAGRDITLVGISYMVLECIRAAEHLERKGVSAEVIDLRTAKPIDYGTILRSVSRTGRLLVADTGHLTCGISAEIIAYITEKSFSSLKSPPTRIASPDCPVPTTPALARYYYPRSHDIGRVVASVLGMSIEATNEIVDGLRKVEELVPADIPDLSFSGPF